MSEELFAQQRLSMVSEQIERHGVRDARVLAAMRSVPRHRFVPAALLAEAYADGPLPIGAGQTISQPYIVARMSELLELKGSERVLEIGAGSGYQAAVLSLLAQEVYTVERLPQLGKQALLLLSQLGYKNVSVHFGDGSKGLAPYAPFGGILVAAAAPSVPPPLLDQLADGARLVIPVGGSGHQSLQVWQRQGERFVSRDALLVSFVPLRGEFGWPEQ